MIIGNEITKAGSLFFKKKVVDELAKGKSVFVFSSGGEFRHLCQLLGGEYIRLKESYLEADKFGLIIHDRDTKPLLKVFERE